MSQNDLVIWFQEQRLTGNEQFYTILELNMIFNNICERSLRRSIIKLYAWGFLEREFRGLALTYRLNDKFINYNFGKEIVGIFDKDISMQDIRQRG